MTPLGEHDLSDIQQNWKSLTSHSINRLLGRKGPFWEEESFDHIVRNAREYERIQAYIRGHVDATSPSRSERGGDATSTRSEKAKRWVATVNSWGQRGAWAFHVRRNLQPLDHKMEYWAPKSMTAAMANPPHGKC